MYIVSACLLGEPCRYDATDCLRTSVVEFVTGKNILAVCPEVWGGLSTPRKPAERKGAKIVRCDGVDVTSAFEKGAQRCYVAARQRALELGEDIEGAILKSKSPSCGCGRIYDGTFSQTLKDGDGVFAVLLREHNISVWTEFMEMEGCKKRKYQK